jgi:hypothetical protein
MSRHELTHACARLWRPEISRIGEPLISPEDEYPESGNSWERFAFGGHITRSPTLGLLICEEFTHLYPAQLPLSLPLAAPVPAKYAETSFLKDTWNSSPDGFEYIQLPSIRRQTNTYLTARLCGKDFKEILCHRGVSLSEIAVEESSAGAGVWEKSEPRLNSSYSKQSVSSKGSHANHDGNWPTPSLEIISKYEREWRQDLINATEAGVDTSY